MARGQIVLLTLALLVVMPPASGREPIDVRALGPQVGERVPDFALRDQNGDTLSLDDILGPKGALILFHRSADW